MQHMPTARQNRSQPSLPALSSGNAQAIHGAGHIGGPGEARLTRNGDGSEPSSLQHLANLLNESPHVAQLRSLGAMLNGTGDGPLRNDPQRSSIGQGGPSPMAPKPAIQLQTGPSAGNRTGLPDDLRSGIEALSGVSMETVKVHYDSPKPAQLKALATAQGNEIHLGPGQERHLPHEAWHVVQQASGRVRPTIQLTNGPMLNDDRALEREADDMGARALAHASGARAAPSLHPAAESATPLQLKWEETEKSGVQRWDKPLSGLIWYFDGQSGKLYYLISDLEQISQDERQSIVEAEGRPYTYEEWLQAGWSGGAGESDGGPESGGTNGTLSLLTPQGGNHEAFDNEFASVFSKTGNRDGEVIVAVLDTGIKPKSDYLRSHVIEHLDATRNPSSNQQNMNEYMDSIKDFHGTKVAGQAAYGTPRIKLIDVRVQTGQIGKAAPSKQSDDQQNNNNDPYQWIAAKIESVIAQGARIVTSSVDLAWENPKIQDVIDRHPSVLFLTTGGNNDVTLNNRRIDAGGEPRTDKTRPNAMLVGGVTLDYQKHPNRGTGSAVDILVPSGGANDGERALSVHVPSAVDAEQWLEYNMINTSDGGTSKDRKISEFEEKIKSAESNLQKNRSKWSISKIKIEQDYIARLARDKSEIETHWSLLSSTSGTIGTESGVSFGIPVIANVAAKIALINPSLSASDIRTILMETADRPDNLDGLSRSGVVNPAAAYEKAMEDKKTAQDAQKDEEKDSTG